VAFKYLCRLIFALLVSFPSVALMAEPKTGQSSNLAKAFSVDTELEARNVLESLDLSFTQKSEIQSILLAAIQSMEAVNNQLNELESDKQRLLSEDIQEMVVALHKQRVQLAEMLSVEILSVLSPQQRAQLKLTPEIEPVREPVSENAVREYET